MISDILFRAVAPALRRVDPETAHRAAILALKAGVYPRDSGDQDPRLQTSLWGRVFPNPVGLAAGFDKHAEVTDALGQLGFGFVEVGGVTPEPQPGNARPRLFRLPEDGAVINRYGLNSHGLEVVAGRLGARRLSGVPVGVNLGKNKESADEAADFVSGLRRLGPLVDFVVVNVSSPNTPGLRDLQGRDAMARIIDAVRLERDRMTAARPVLLVKLAPDLDDAALADIAQVAQDTGLDGLVMGNTTTARPAHLTSRHRGEAGGLSGRPLKTLSTERLATLYRMTGGRVPLVGCGGIESGADAYAKIRAGASLVQLYSALVFAGPGLVGRIRRDLSDLLRRDGFATVAEAVGADQRAGGGI